MIEHNLSMQHQLTKKLIATNIKLLGLDILATAHFTLLALMVYKYGEEWDWLGFLIFPIIFKYLYLLARDLVNLHHEIRYLNKLKRDLKT